MYLYRQQILAAAGTGALRGLPPCVEALFDKRISLEDDAYYWNTETDEVTWEFPAEALFVELRVLLPV